MHAPRATVTLTYLLLAYTTLSSGSVRTATNLGLIHRTSAYAFKVSASHLHRTLVGLFVREMKLNQHNGNQSALSCFHPTSTQHVVSAFVISYLQVWVLVLHSVTHVLIGLGLGFRV